MTQPADARRSEPLFRVGRRDDEGFILLTVVMTMVMVTALVTAALAYSQASQKLSRGDQDYNAALAAAQAGVEDYIAHLNRNDNYARQNPFADCANVAIRGPKAPTPHNCPGLTGAVGWQPINAGDPNGPAFHYDVDASQLNSRGIIDVRATGRSRAGGETRTLQAAVGRGGSTDFLYYTDHEDADPDNKLSYPSGMKPACYNYWWGKAPDAPSSVTAARSGTSSNNGCSEITFIGGDVFDGRVHTNDTPLYTKLSGVSPQFKEGVQTADPKCKLASRTNASTWMNCDRNGTSANFGSSYPQWAEPLYLPDNSAAFAAYPGCQYSGATRLIFNSDGTMKVWSRETTPGTAACGGDKPDGVTVPVPTDKVIYVKAAGTKRQCLAQEIDGTLPLGTYNGSNTQPSYTYDENMTLADQHCGQGNAYVQGTLKGRVTVATQNSIVVTGDVKLAGGANGSDLMGLVAANSVEVFHPIVSTYDCETSVKPRKGGVETCTTYAPAKNPTYPSGWPVDIAPVSATAGVEINASIQTLQHSFFVQSFHRGSNLGKLTVIGSIAQKWRGAVGTGAGTTGYFKDYRYDKRLKYSSPPYFPQFINAVWSSRATGEIQADY
jgi:hypothetical protein